MNTFAGGMKELGAHPGDGRRRFHSRAAVRKALALLVDLLLFAVFMAIVCLFFGHNGFIGHQDIQPYPY